MSGRAGANEFVFSAVGRNVVKDFGASPSNMLDFSNSGFNLGLQEATRRLKQLLSYLFAANKTDRFTTAAQRFAYHTTDGRLFFDADGNGNGGTKHLVVTLPDDATIHANQLFFRS